MGRDVIWELFVLFLFFVFLDWLLKCCNVQQFLAKCTYFTLVRQHHQHRFQHPPHVQPTSPSSPANRGPWLPAFSASSVVCMLKRGAGPRGFKYGQTNPCNSGEVGGGAAAPPMMIEKAMIQLGLHFNLCQKSKK